jgi:hypothetical protein
VIWLTAVDTTGDSGSVEPPELSEELSVEPELSEEPGLLGVTGTSGSSPPPEQAKQLNESAIAPMNRYCLIVLFIQYYYVFQKINQSYV